MSIISIAVKHLIAAGVTGNALVSIIEEMELSEKPIRSTNAERQFRFRERNKALRNVTSVTSNAQSVTNRNESVTSNETLYTKEVSKKEESKKVSKIIASRFSLEAIPSDWETHCRSRRSDLDPQETFDAFRDWWIAQPGGKGLKTDWFATWRTWLRNQNSKAKKNGHSRISTSSQPTKSERADAAMFSALADLGINPAGAG